MEVYIWIYVMGLWSSFRLKRSREGEGEEEGAESGWKDHGNG